MLKRIRRYQLKIVLYLVGLIGILILLTSFYLMRDQSSEIRTIEMTNSGFVPQSLIVKEGDKVRFINRDSIERWPASNIHPTHEIYSEFDPLKPVRAGESWEFEFKKEGNWVFHDHLEPGYTGKIVVMKSDKKPDFFSSIPWIKNVNKEKHVYNKNITLNSE
jgi:plastocyanin